jgi:hypothetical protein
MKIIGNNHIIPVFYLYELPEKDQETVKSDYDWMREDEIQEAYFFKYRGNFYALQDFMPSNLPEYDGVLSDSYFSGVYIKLVGEYGDLGVKAYTFYS